MTARASTFYTTTSMAHNNLSLVHKQYTVHVPHCGKMTLHHHIMANNLQHVPQLQKIIHNTTTQPNRYHTYQMTIMKNQVHQIPLCWTHLTHRNTDILNENDIRVINTRENS